MRPFILKNKSGNEITIVHMVNEDDMIGFGKTKKLDAYDTEWLDDHNYTFFKWVQPTKWDKIL